MKIEHCWTISEHRNNFLPHFLKGIPVWWFHRLQPSPSVPPWLRLENSLFPHLWSYFLEDEIPVNTPMSHTGWASFAGCFAGTFRTGHVLILVDCELDLSFLLLLFWEHTVNIIPLMQRASFPLSPLFVLRNMIWHKFFCAKFSFSLWRSAVYSSFPITL